MNPQPQTKSNEIYLKIEPSIKSGQLLLPETDLYRLLREARSIPIEYESLSIQGLIYIVWGKLEDGISLCERSLLLDPYSPASWINYALAMGQKGYHQKQLDILRRSIEFESPISLKLALDMALFWADIPLVINSLSLIKKLNIETKDEERALSMASLYARDENIAKDITNLARCVMEIADELKLKKCHSYLDNDMDSNYCFVYQVDDASPNELVALNNLLAQKIVDKGLAGSDAIAIFERGEHVN
ncbi:hypothetical protein [Providencia sp.]|uniref:hypothetical protein n=1 Tax=Providencia sp. TaxID=589 RepID=UPI003F9B5CEF